MKITHGSGARILRGEMCWFGVNKGTDYNGSYRILRAQCVGFGMMTVQMTMDPGDLDLRGEM